jgi:hypothetical protein
LKWSEEKPNFNASEYSMYSTEASSFSHWWLVQAWVASFTCVWLEFCPCTYIAN